MAKYEKVTPLKVKGKVTSLPEYQGAKVGSPVKYRGCVWTIAAIKQGAGTYPEDDAPVALDLEWCTGEVSGPTRITVGWDCVKPIEALDAMVASTRKRKAKESPSTNHEREAIEDPRRVCTSGRVFLRPTHPVEHEDGTQTPRTIIAGIVLGDIGVGGNGEWPEDELWMCDVIILRPVQKYRGSKCKGYTVDQMLTGTGLQPEGYTTPLTE